VLKRINTVTTMLLLVNNTIKGKLMICLRLFLEQNKNCI